MNSAKNDSPLARAPHRRQPRYDRIAFVASPITEAQEALGSSPPHTATCAPETADVIVALGGDGLMLQSLHTYMNSGKPIYGMHRGTVGFLMNEFRAERLARTARSGAAHHHSPAAYVRA